MRKRFPRSIRSSISIYFSLMMAGMLILISAMLYSNALNNMRTKAADDALQIAKLVGNRIDDYLSYTEDVASLLRLSPDMFDYLEKVEKGFIVDASKMRLQRTLENLASIRSDIVSVFVIDSKLGSVHTSNLELKPAQDIPEQGWYRAALAAGGNMVFFPTHVQQLLAGQAPWVVSLSCEIRGENGQHLGVILIDLNYKVIDNICAHVDLGEKGYVFIIDSAGNIVFHPQLQLIYTGIKSEDVTRLLAANDGSFEADGKLYTLSSMQSGWKTVGVSYIDELVMANSELLRTTVVIAIVTIFLTLLASVAIARSITRPLESLEKQMGCLQEDHLETEIEIIPSTEEIERLGLAFQSLLTQVNTLLTQIRMDQEQLRASEIRVLQAQINPHFLYNTLESIVWMAEDGQNAAVVSMTSALAKYFRIALSHGQELISIRDELTHVYNYLVIQKFRYVDALRFTIEQDSELCKLLTPKLIVQPIVENAIYHGLRPKSEGGLIRVQVLELGEKICIRVEDDGVGIDQNEIPTILEREPSAKMKLGSVGLKNVHERITLSFGSEYGLVIRSQKGAGTTVDIILPRLDGAESIE